jgi:hypothetical protein
MKSSRQLSSYFDPASAPKVTTPGDFKPIFLQSVPILDGYSVNI